MTCLIPPHGTASAQDLILIRVVLNGEDMREFFVVSAEDNDIWIRREDLNQTKLVEGLGKDVRFEGETYVPLSSIPGLEYKLNMEDVYLDVIAPTHLFKKQYIDASVNKPLTLGTAKDVSAFINYDLDYSNSSLTEQMNVFSEIGIGTGDIFGRSTFSFTKTADIDKAQRLMSDLTITDRKNLRTITAGDINASSGVYGTSVKLGGINVSKNYSISPYLIKDPTLNLSGTLDSPSNVEVYLNDSLTRKENLSPGEFEFDDLHVQSGAGTARMVIRDTYGRESVILTPYYFSSRLLKKGIHEYSYSAGFRRESFSTKNFDYGPPAFLANHNFGVTDTLKIGYSSEVSSDLINLGTGGVLLIPNAGVLDASLTASRFTGLSGWKSHLAYSYVSRNFNAMVAVNTTSSNYYNLSMTPSSDRDRVVLLSSIGFGRGETGFIQLSYVHAETYEAGPASRIAVSYNKTLTGDTSFFMTANRTKDSEINNEILAGLRMYLGSGVSGSVSYGGSKGSDIKEVRVQKSPPTSTGFGYSAYAENTRNSTNASGNLRYQNSYGLYGINVSRLSDENSYSMSYAGGIGYIGKSLFISRPISGSFAKVKVSNLEGVRVYSSNNEIGRTDKNGEVIIPNLQSFHENKIDIEAADIPIDYSIETLTQRITLPYRSASLVEFAVYKRQAITGSVYLDELPLEYALIYIKVKDKTFDGIVGSDGEFYIENVPAGKYTAEILFKGQACRFDMIIPDSNEMIVDTGKNLCRTVQ